MSNLGKISKQAQSNWNDAKKKIRTEAENIKNALFFFFPFVFPAQTPNGLVSIFFSPGNNK